MCGIFGYDLRPGALSEGQRAILGSSLAFLNDKRGGQSWGLLGYDEDLEKLVIKRGLGEFASSAHKLIAYNRMFGHSRTSTTGAITIENAHPFKIDKVIGAHNGVLYNHDELNRKYNRNFSVDSMHLFAHINEGHNFSDIRGYGAIEWYEKGDNKAFNICKLSGGSLAVCLFGTDELDGVIWSSDIKHLEEAVAATGITNAFPFSIEEGRVYSIYRHDIMVTDKNLELSKSYTTTYTGGGANYNRLAADDSEDEDMTDLMRKYLKMSPPVEEKKALPPHVKAVNHEDMNDSDYVG